MLAEKHTHSIKKDTKIEFIQSQERLKKAYNHIQNINNHHLQEKYYVEYYCNDVLIENEIGLLNYYLITLSKLDNTYNIKKCSKCKKYYLFKPGNSIACDRLVNGTLLCRVSLDKSTRENKKSDPIYNLEKKVKDLVAEKVFTTSKYHDTYHKNKKAKREELNDKEYILWLLSFYKKPSSREENYKILNLSSYGISIKDLEEIKTLYNY